MSNATLEMTDRREYPVLEPGQTYASVTDQIGDVVLRRTPGRLWWFGVVFTMGLVTLLIAAVSYLIVRGVGIWGIDIPVAWGFAIVNFVWWVGIGHAGTFISAMLLLMRQDWRTSINRFAEAMTLFAVACAGMFPLLHLGRIWRFWYIVPYPNVMWLWPQFRSPLVWDVFAVSTYLTVSLIYWYVGLLPDLATMRDKAKSRIVKLIYATMAMGWRGSAMHWQRYQSAYLLLGGLAAPLVISVHSVVGMDFAGAQIPGWHSTILPPYFVAGAIFSGFAMVLTLGIPMRWAFGLKDMITLRHIDNCAKFLLITGLIVDYSYGMEMFMGWYSGDTYESFITLNRAIGPYAWSFWLIMFTNVVTTQFLWIRKVRQNVPLMFVIAFIIQVGMWTERFVIVVISLHRDFVPSSWGMYYPTFWDYATLAGTIGFFLFCFFLFARLIPVISISEMRELVHSTGGGKHVPKSFSPSYVK
ncbi:MAG TPA: NrfD/PsrC family molybdoenzyme membrane anchor subunit [Tepidisphaeraceae bacterium]|jgi:molybdopterin-containing oxidoreductase family membrane subunit|nr:NrfD/PsrC family molybdoenzyme membrane anchor subunit [Tepidisphaeraceae bacterium]